VCGRYTLRTPVEELAERFGVDGPLPEEYAPSYNVAPSREVLAVYGDDEDGRAMGLFTWGLVPSWSRASKPGPINARAETVAEKPSFRRSFRGRRALVPADGYYEWKGDGGGPKQPYYFTVRGGEPFAFAGLWDVWHEGQEDELRTCALITTKPNPLAATVHDRMPAILPPSAYADWLDPESDPEDLLHLLEPYPPDEMEAWPVSTRVNRPSNDDERCVMPVA
jgi:putative SOS response-associated peptidase YedK